MQTVEFKHETGKKVTMANGQVEGIVTGNFIDKSGEKETLVEYFDKSGARQRHYIPENEVE